jgi:hypothetical protein
MLIVGALSAWLSRGPARAVLIDQGVVTTNRLCVRVPLFRGIRGLLRIQVFKHHDS